MNIQVAKRVELKASSTGSPNANYYVNKVSVSPSFVLVRGDSTALNKVPTTLDLDSINVQDATEDRTRNFDVKALFTRYGVTLVKETDASATIKAEISKYETKELAFTSSNISILGQDSQYQYTFTPEGNFTISIRGKQEDIANLNKEKITLTLDLTDKSVGTYDNMKLGFKGLDETLYTVVSSPVFTVVIANSEGDFAPSPEPTGVIPASLDSSAMQ